MNRTMRSHSPRRTIGAALIASAMLFCCMGQSCNTAPLTQNPDDEQVLGYNPGSPSTTNGETPSDGTLSNETITPDSGATSYARDVAVIEGEQVTLDFSETTGMERIYTWVQLSGPAISLPETNTAVFSFTAPGVDTDTEIIISYTVSGAASKKSSYARITVRDASDPFGDLVIVASAEAGVEPLRVSFSAGTISGAALPQGTYWWKFGDGSTAEGAVVNHSYKTGTWVATLCVALSSGVTTQGCKEKQISVRSKSAEGGNTPLPQITGVIRENGAALAGVTIRTGDAISSTTTLADGSYSLSVPLGWSGTVAPVLTGYTVAPLSYTLTNVQGDVPNQDFAASPIIPAPVITGTLKTNTNAPLPNVTLVGTNTASATVTAADGTFSMTVPLNWSGSITPQLTGYSLAPASLAFVNVQANLTGQNFVATRLNTPPVANAGPDQTIINNGGGSVDVQLNGSGSSDSDGTITGYAWIKGASTLATTMNPTISLANGIHTIKLQVTDNSGAVSEDTVIITISTPQTYYVSPLGKDTWSGRLASPNVGNTDGPFLTPLKAGTVAVAGDTVYLRGGTYTRNTGLIYRAVLEVVNNGTASAPITFKAFPNEEVIIDGNGQNTYAVRVGNPVGSVGCSYIILDGLKVTRALVNGIYGINSDHLIIRNCEVYRNNQQYEILGNASSTAAGIHLVQCHDSIVEDNRIYNNGSGILFFELDMSIVNPTGARNCSIRRNFVYCNANANAYGNSSGVAYRFADHSTIEDNVIYDNPDAAINGLGNVMCRYERNALLNSWQSPGNMSGFKSSVRGGGGNLVAFNIIAANGSEGYDASDSIGDILVGNTIYGNSRWGVLSEGRDLLFFNNISYLNFVGNNGYMEWTLTHPNQYIDSSDYNWFGMDNHPVMALQPHSKKGNPSLASPILNFPRNDPRQIVHPEALFTDGNADGRISIAEAQATLALKFKLNSGSQARSAGVNLAAVQTAAINAVPRIQATCDARIAEVVGSTNLVFRQKGAMWDRVKTYLGTADRGGFENLSSAKDFLGRPVGLSTTPHMGALLDP